LASVAKPDSFLLAGCRKRGEKRIGVQVPDQRRQHAIGDIGDYPDVVALERLQHDAMPGLLDRLFAGRLRRGFFLRNGHAVLLLLRDNRLLASKLDGADEIVNMHPWPAQPRQAW